jgi:hypothetical protein
MDYADLLKACGQVSPHWTTYVSVLSTPIVALIAAVFAGTIAYRQWRTAQNRLKLDLFDKRFAVYHETMKFLSHVMIKGGVGGDELLKFNIGIREAKWLLDDDIDNYLKEEIRKNASSIRTLATILVNMPVGVERTANVDKESQLLTWIMEQPDVVDTKFRSYLKLNH